MTNQDFPTSLELHMEQYVLSDPGFVHYSKEWIKLHMQHRMCEIIILRQSCPGMTVWDVRND